MTWLVCSCCNYCFFPRGRLCVCTKKRTIDGNIGLFFHFSFFIFFLFWCWYSPCSLFAWMYRKTEIWIESIRHAVNAKSWCYNYIVFLSNTIQREREREGKRLCLCVFNKDFKFSNNFITFFHPIRIPFVFIFIYSFYLTISNSHIIIIIIIMKER